VGEKGKIAKVDLEKTFGIAKRYGYKDIFRWNGTARAILTREPRG